MLSEMASTDATGNCEAAGVIALPGFVKPPPALDLDNQSCRISAWRNWKRQWDAFADLVDLSKKSASKQYNTLIVTIGYSALATIDTFPLNFDNDEDRKDLPKILELPEKQLTANERILYERFKFYRRTQQPGESAEAFIADLRKLARTCQFKEDGKDYSHQMIRTG